MSKKAFTPAPSSASARRAETQSLLIDITEVARLLHPEATRESARKFIAQEGIPIVLRTGRGGTILVARAAVLRAVANAR